MLPHVDLNNVEAGDVVVALSTMSLWFVNLPKFYLGWLTIFVFCTLPIVVPEGVVGNLTYESISSTAINVSWGPPSQPNGLVFYYVSLSSQQTPRHVRPPLVTYERSMYFDNLEKYTDYVLKVTPSTEKGFSDTYTAQLHIRTEEDGRLDPFIAYYADSWCSLIYVAFC